MWRAGEHKLLSTLKTHRSVTLTKPLNNEHIPFTKPSFSPPQPLSESHCIGLANGPKITIYCYNYGLYYNKGIMDCFLVSCITADNDVKT